MKGQSGNAVEEKFDRVILLLQQLVVLELSRRGASQEVIGRNVTLAKSTVVKMMSGIKKESAHD
jgi:hypothetical protein